MTVLRDQQVREVGARRLRHDTAAVIRSVADGARLIVTRHGRPQAVVLSVNDAIEMLVEPDLPALAQAAAMDLRDGRVQAVEPPGPCALLLSEEAAVAHSRMNAPDRFQLRVALVRGKADAARPLWLRSRRWLVAFSYPDEATVLVHGAFEVRELERELIGEEIWMGRRRRDAERRVHGRGLAPAGP